MWINEDTLEFEFESSEQAAGFVDHALTQPGVLDAYSAYRRVLVVVDHPDVSRSLKDFQQQNTAPSSPRHLRVPVCYSPSMALDLPEVAQQTGLPEDAVVKLHCARPLQVLAMGFAPGFGYLGELSATLHLPRKTTPRQRIPAGSVAIAEGQSVIYPRETPGGWHVIGRSPVSLMNYASEPEPLWRVGDWVTFFPITPERFDAWSE